MEYEQLPEFIQEIMRLVPDTAIGRDGVLQFVNGASGTNRNVRSKRTDWNLENTQPYDLLRSDKPWGIVLHWFGDKYAEQQNLDYYLRGFNGKRWFDEFYTSTSAHFLVGENPPTHNRLASTVGIVQTQKPGPEGTPYQAAHIRYLDHEVYESGNHYLVSALDQLYYEDRGVRTLLQDFYTQPGVLAHLQTIAIEITGYDFDNPVNYPGPQKIANVISVVWAIMKRYRIKAIDIMGHFELQLGKPDPGKKLLALIKFLIGIKALIEDDDEMKTLVFSPFEAAGSPQEQTLAYFSFIRNYLLLTTSPKQIYEWDAWSKYLVTIDVLKGDGINPRIAKGFTFPLAKPYWTPGNRFLEPSNHEGVDLYPNHREVYIHGLEQNVYLIANGVCIYLGESGEIHDGLLAIFKHRQVDGSEIISYYGHLRKFRNLEVGFEYRAGWAIGTISTPQEPPYGYLHFSIAYGPSWEGYLQHHPKIPIHVDPVWVDRYFIDPMDFLTKAPMIQRNDQKNTRLIPK
jgi:hypothetical protein